MKINESKKLVGFVILALVVACNKDENNPPDPVEDARIYKKAESPLGQTVRQWTEAWVKFELSRSCEDASTLSAVTIPGQNQLMVFLKGTILSHGTANISILQGQSIFVPLVSVNYPTPTCPSWIYHINPGQNPESFLANACKQIINDVQNQFLKIDGTEVSNPEKYRYQTPMFSLTPYSDLQSCSPYCLPAGELQIMTEGDFIVIKPLPAGTHTLQLYARNSDQSHEFYSMFNVTVI